MTYTLPAFISGSTEIAGIPVDYQRLLVVGIGIAVVALLWLFTHYTRIGLALRGMAQDERAAMMLGIDSDLMAVTAMGFGSMLAALAAIKERRSCRSFSDKPIEKENLEKIAVAGDPKKSGVDQCMEGGAKTYEHTCAAAVQNMMLTAHVLDIGSVWFTLFDREKLRGILDLGPDKVPLALVSLGKTAADPAPTPRTGFAEPTTY